MKKINLFACAAALCMLPVLPAYAADYHEPYSSEYNEDMIESMFSDLDDDDLVLQLPDGGFLYGECTDTDINDESKILAQYNSETDPNSITVAEARELLLEQSENPSIMPFGASPPGTGTMRTLNYGDVYTSNPFSGSGWRFSGAQFKPASGTGDYLRWSSYVDGGRVGNYNEGYATKYGGSLQGTAINAGTTIWNSEGGLGQIYYTYNPIAGTYYVVANLN